MRIDLTKYAMADSSSIRIYRSYNIFTADNLPPLLVELPPNTESWTDHTLELNRLVYYRVSVVTPNAEICGSMYTTMKTYYTGPHVNQDNPDMVLRGNMSVGRFGELSSDEVYPLTKLITDFPSLSILDPETIDEVRIEKCIANGKILFIPSRPVVQGSLRDLYDSGLLTDSGNGSNIINGVFFNTLNPKVTQNQIVHANGYTYKLRLLTNEERLNVYAKLYPTSDLGSTQSQLIGNLNPHAYRSPLQSTIAYNQTGNYIYGLDFLNRNIDFDVVSPLFLILELVNRNDSIFPDPLVEIKDVAVEDRMADAGAEVLNGRVHFFGGCYSLDSTGTVATTRHISFDLNGEDEQIHAPLPEGVIKPVTWVHNGKIYCFGGYQTVGATETTRYNNTQVWENDGTGQGTWITLPGNIQYSYSASWTVYFDTNLNKDVMFIYGGYRNTPGIPATTYFYTVLDDFDGSFITGNTSNISSTGGAALGAYRNNLYMLNRGESSSYSGSGTSTIPLPINLPFSFTINNGATTGSEMDAGRFGRFGNWRDTMFFLNNPFSRYNSSDLLFYQWVTTERRWIKLKLPAPIPNITTEYPTLSPVYHDNKLYVLVCRRTREDSAVSKLYVVTLQDPTEAPLVPIVEVGQQVDRIYPINFSVGEQ